jgi:hypothetical protein
MLPFLPFIEKMWDYSFASEVWNKVYTNNQISTLFQDLTLFSTLNTATYNVMTYNLPVQAIAAPNIAYNHFQNYRGFAGNFDDGTSKSNCFYGILTRMYATIGINNIGTEIPQRYMLYDAYPNQFNPVTTIKFDLAKSGFVELQVFDILGRKIKTLVNQEMKTGKYTVDLNGSDLSSGVYIYKLQADNFASAKKIILIK